ncbi:ferric enterobactin receptor [Halopseudomonas litoralis]|uniref:Ferric enterobactin receptor n=1 Tax=Halopseudomonas litoralis TaxID=797277 RepID=A0A1H1PNU1_9GAMM|nr:TonB-dependent siderophore receptor [Halopseudomonas litoralis]SDS12764.1 ferric enterobactin receptor [Halopseudomonas litoralis]
MQPSTVCQVLRYSRLSLAILLALGAQQALAEEPLELDSVQVIGTAQEELKQAPGVSIITAEDIRKSPPANDIAELIRKQPGVNLTGNSGSGARGNSRQIDIRGMGPENTLILVDGKPVSSRNAVRYGWRGDRDTRGDTNWVPAEQIERIEVLRGPAAARYGDGAAGGVVNIITKGPGLEHHGDMTVYMNLPQHSEEGASKRINFGLNGPLSEDVAYRVYGNISKTDRDDEDINEGHTIPGYATAGREGVRNKDINGLLSWYVTDAQQLELEAGYSRQGNIYAGDSMNNVASAKLEELRSPWLGRESNVMYRQNYAITHRGDWDFGRTVNYLQFERTENRRLEEGLAGGPEGSILNSNFGTIKLDTTTAHSELNMPLSGPVEQMLTLGAEWVEQRMDDPFSNNQSTTEAGAVAGLINGARNTKSAARVSSVFAESNMELRPGTILTPGLRFDHHSKTGSNWSPALNLSQALGENFTLKAGIARAYKTPNLYQSNPNYLLYSRGNGCWGGAGACYLQGNDKLDAETSVNKEIGIEFHRDDWVAGITWFRNDYKNKIESGRSAIGQAAGGSNPDYADADIFQWENVPKAVVEGLEGALNVPVTSALEWHTNFTYMLRSENRDTGEPLSVIPEYTVNSQLDWQINKPFSVQADVTWYGKQKPGKLGYQGNTLTGDARRQISPYALAGLSGQYEFSERLSLAAGVSNLFDKRLYREGNANVAGAYTYNEPGRTFYTSLSTSF